MPLINTAALAAHNAAAARAFDKTSDEVDELNILLGKQAPSATESSKAPVASTFVSTDDKQFRQYENASDRVKRFYAEQHARQTVEFNVAVRELFERTRGERARMGVWDALELLGTLVDESDPDTELTQIEHAFQTAEAMRRDNQPEYMQAVGLVHDLGKLLFFFNFPGGEFQTGANSSPAPSQQWSVVGDTFPVGCAFSPSIVLAKDTFAANPDSTDPRYTSECGIYEPGCGIDNVMMSWGHDEYLYRVLKGHCELPEEGLAMIRYHSFYPWHRDNAYSHLMKPSDEKLLKAVRAFNPYDLYSKADAAPDAEALQAYYKGLVARWFPHELDW